MKVIDFKTVSPLFEMERDGVKPFTVRRADAKDKRFKALSQWNCELDWGIRITNPATGESFVRRIKSTSYLWHDDLSGENPPGLEIFQDWRMIDLGEIVND